MARQTTFKEIPDVKAHKELKNRFEAEQKKLAENGKQIGGHEK